MPDRRPDGRFPRTQYERGTLGLSPDPSHEYEGANPPDDDWAQEREGYTPPQPGGSTVKVPLRIRRLVMYLDDPSASLEQTITGRVYMKRKGGDRIEIAPGDFGTLEGLGWIEPKSEGSPFYVLSHHGRLAVIRLDEGITVGDDFYAPS